MRRGFGVRLGWLLAAMALAALLSAGRPAAAQSVTEITLLNDTHLHGYLTGANDVTYANVAGVIKGRRAQLANSLYLGGGDDLGASPMSSFFKGAQMVEAFNAAGLDANTFGNHEFDYGPDNLVEQVRASRFPWVSANVRDKRTGEVFAAEAGAKPFIIKDVGGVAVGVTGAAWSFSLATNAGPDVEVVPAASALPAVVAQMRASGAQLVVVLVHMPTAEAEGLATAVNGIDVILGDHDDSPLAEPKLLGSTIIARRGADYKPFAELTLRLEAGRLAGFTYRTHEITKDSPADAAVAGILKSYQDRLQTELTVVVGATAVPFDTRNAAVRTRESNIGNYIADTLRAWGRADVAITNGGGIRGNKVFEPGPLTRGDVLTLLPFSNTAALVRIDGAGLLAALENGVSQRPTEATLPGRFPQVSGLRFTVDWEAAEGARVANVTVGDTPLEHGRLYTLATNDFMANGGDGYAALTAAESLIAGQAGPLLSDLLAEAVARDGMIAPQEEGRITIAGGAS